MQVKEIMCTEFKIIDPKTTLRDAAKLMDECECGYLPVGAKDKLVGTITDRDIVVRALAKGQGTDTPVEKAMTKKVFYCFEDEDVEKAAESLKEQQIRRLIVLNRDKRMTGIVTVGDIARAVGDKSLTGDIEHCVARAA